MGRCEFCSSTFEGKKHPRNWRRIKSGYVCGQCFKGRSRTFAVEFQIAEPLDMSWEKFNSEMTELWRLNTIAANALALRMLQKDVIRTELQQSTLPRFDGFQPELESGASQSKSKFNGYAFLRAVCPSLRSHMCSYIERNVQADYKRHRFDVWRAVRSPLHYKYPYPVKFRGHSAAREVKCEIDLNGELFISLNLDGWVKLRLKREAVRNKDTGAKWPAAHRPHVKVFRDIVEGSTKLCEVVLLKKRAPGQIENGIITRDASKNKVWYRTVVKLVVNAPKEQVAKTNDKVMVVKTTADSFWIAQVRDSDVWRLNGDDVRRNGAVHSAFLHRMSDDRKYERRVGDGNMLIGYSRRRIDKYTRWRDDWLHKTACSLVDYAKRQFVSKLEYHDNDTSFVPSFPWHKLKLLVADKAVRAGIEFVDMHVQLPDDES